jgi:hypothetical protein
MGEMLNALEVMAQAHRNGYKLSVGWHLTFPAYLFERREELKESYERMELYLRREGCVGFQFADEWPAVGQRFTYLGNGRWDR